MRIIKQVLLYSTIIAVSLLAILVVFGFIFQDRIVNSVVSEINKKLNSEVNVEEFSFSLISHFPKASVNMANVTAYESKKFAESPDTLLHCQTLSLSFSIWDVINDDLTLGSIIINDGYVNLEIDKKGVENYMIVNSDTSESSSFFLNLDQVTLSNSTVNFRDFRSQDKYGFYFPFVVAKGTFSSSEITTAVYGNTQVNALILDNTPYLTNEKGKVDIGIEIDIDEGRFQISRGFVTLREKYDFDVKGKSDNKQYYYTFEAKNLDLRQAETLIPKKHIAFINAYQLDGNANVLIELTKKRNAEHPKISGNFDVWDGRFQDKSSKVTADINKVVGRFDMGKLTNPTTTQIWIEEFNLTSNISSASGKISISNLTHPWFRLSSTGKMDLGELSGFTNFENGFAMNGVADFDVQLTGSIQELDSITSRDLNTLKGKARIQLSAGNFTVPSAPTIESVNANIVLNQDVVLLDTFTGNIAHSATSGSIQVKNWLQYVIDRSKPLDIHADLVTKSIDSKNWTNNSTADEKTPFAFPSGIYINGSLNAEELIHKKTHLTNLITDFSYSPNVLRLTNTSFHANDGNVKLNFSMDQRPTGFGYNLDLLTQDVDIQDLLATYENFGQSAVTEQHIRGELSSNLKMSFTTDTDFTISKPSIKVAGNIIVVNGEMIENKMLTEIPAEIESNKILNLFINLDAFEKRLHHIKFDTIRNFITIENSVLTIPEMHISSTALQIDVSGEHSFSNEIDYYLSFSLDEVLHKDKKVKSDYGYIVDDGGNKRMMFLHLYTKKGKIEVDLDKEGSRKYRHSKTNKEVHSTKSLLKGEFGFFEKDTTLTTAKSKQEFEYEIDLGEFADDSTTQKTDSTKVKKDSTKLRLKKKKKKKTKEEEEEEFEEFDFEDDDY